MIGKTNRQIEITTSYIFITFRLNFFLWNPEMKTEKPQAFLIDIISKYKKGSHTTHATKSKYNN